MKLELEIKNTQIQYQLGFTRKLVKNHFEASTSEVMALDLFRAGN